VGSKNSFAICSPPSTQLDSPSGHAKLASVSAPGRRSVIAGRLLHSGPQSQQSCGLSGLEPKPPDVQERRSVALPNQRRSRNRRQFAAGRNPSCQGDASAGGGFFAFGRMTPPLLGQSPGRRPAGRARVAERQRPVSGIIWPDRIAACRMVRG
jgi:hypothetical protein